MAFIFSESQLTRPTVPAAWAPIIDDLRDFRRRCRTETGTVLPANLRAAHDALVEASAALLEPAAVDDVTPQQLDRLFARSVFQLARLRQAAISDSGDDDFVLLDTVGCKTLGLFEPDFSRDPLSLPALKGRLRHVTSLSDAELWEIERDVEADFGDARRKNAVVAALRERYALDAASPTLDADVHRLFCDLYPGSPLEAGEVGLVLTPTLLLLVLPFGKKGLESPRWAALDAAARDTLLAFWRNVNSVTLSLFSHFPAFSHLDLQAINVGLVEFVSRRTGLSDAAVREEVGRMVTVLPRDKLDAYAVHDVWGHASQAALLRFDDLYARIAGFAKPLEPTDSAEGVTLADVLAGGFDAGRFGWFCGAMVAERLPICLTAVFAEMMADVAEYKLMALHPEAADLIPNTSLFKAMPTKLDFILRDLGLIYPKATEALDRLLAVSPPAEPLDAAAAAAGPAPRPAAAAAASTPTGVSDEAVKTALSDPRAASVWGELKSFTFAPELAHRPAAEDGRIEVPLFTLCALHFLGVHRAVLRAYAAAEALDPAAAALPLKSYRDLLILCACAFFEGDPARNLWRVDEFLGLQVLPLLERFQAVDAIAPR